MTNDDENITPFPGDRERRGRMRLKPANDGPPPEPMFNLPPVVKGLSLAVMVVFLLQQVLPYLVGADLTDALEYAFAFVPARYSGDLPFGFPAIVAPVTHLFLHGGWLHIGVNLLSLIAFGAGLEKFLGGKKMLMIYFGSGLCGALAQFMAGPHIESPVIGASGAISGVFGALLIQMYDRGYMNSGGSGPGGLKKILPFILIWIVAAVIFGQFGIPGSNALIAWVTHIGGFLGGIILCRPVARMKI